MSYRHAKKPASVTRAQQQALIRYVLALVAAQRKKRAVTATHGQPKEPDQGQAILTSAVRTGLSFVPVVGPVLGALAAPIVSGLHDWFSAGEAGETFFHETYLPKASTLTTDLSRNPGGTMFNATLTMRKTSTRMAEP